MKICPECGAQLQDTVKFCTKCGCNVAKHESEKEKGAFCPECGARVEAGTLFCPECGCGLDAASAEETAAETGGLGDIGDLADIESGIDALFEKQEEEEELFRQKFAKARSLCIRGKYSEAEAVCNEMTDERPEDPRGYIGLIRVVSKNYTLLEGDAIEGQIRVAAQILKDEKFGKTDEEYVAYERRRAEHAAALQEAERKRKEAEERAKKEKEEKLRLLEKQKREAEEAARLQKAEQEKKEREERERARLEERKRRSAEARKTIEECTARIGNMQKELNELSKEKEKVQPDYEAKKAAYEKKTEKRKKRGDAFDIWGDRCCYIVAGVAMLTFVLFFALSPVLDSWYTVFKVIFIVIGTPIVGIVVAFLGAIVTGIVGAFVVGDIRESIKDPAYEAVREKYNGIVGKVNALEKEIGRLTEEIKQAKIKLG